MHKQKKEKTEEERLLSKETSSAFLTMFPTLIIAVLAIATTKIVWIALIIILLVIYQWIMQKKFLEDYYKRYR